MINSQPKQYDSIYELNYFTCLHNPGRIIFMVEPFFNYRHFNICVCVVVTFLSLNKTISRIFCFYLKTPYVIFVTILSLCHILHFNICPLTFYSMHRLHVLV